MNDTSNTYNFDPMTGAPLHPPVRPAKPQMTFTAKESALAWVSALIGYLLCRCFWVWDRPMTALIFTVCLFVYAFVFFGKQKRNRRCWFYPVSALILSLGFFFSGSPVLLFFVFIYIRAAFFLFNLTGSEAAIGKRAGRFYVFELAKALFGAPFRRIGAASRGIAANSSSKKAGRTLLLILGGIGVAIIPTLIVARLLSYDSNFTGILDRIRSAISDGLISRIWSLIFGVPLGMYYYASLYAASHPANGGYTEEKCENIGEKMKVAPSLLIVAAIVPLLFLYGIFIVAQRDYYGAILASSLPGAYTFADFARDGFFRLCAAASINALALISIRIFTKRANSGAISPVVRICSVILSVFTVVISLTAMSQMIMYVSAYGLTRLRLYTMWFMALLILVFLLAILKQFFERLHLTAILLGLLVICFGLLAVPDHDAFIAEHNYNCYIEGMTGEIDADYLTHLGPSSVPTLCRLAGDEGLSEGTKKSVLYGIGRSICMDADTDATNINLPLLRARSACGDLDPAIYAEAVKVYTEKR
ncbi:MAG: DUF4173 domain-containing protein [Lachnospiraceae bacterium]|nr:DUF4173 domain-containing protein [Lachnospiraceae bacterium]